MSRVLSLAGFQVTLIGRFWVTPEGPSKCKKCPLSKPDQGWLLSYLRREIPPPLIRELVGRENHTSFPQVPIIHAREEDVGGIRLASRVDNLVDHQDEESG